MPVCKGKIQVDDRRLLLIGVVLLLAGWVSEHGGPLMIGGTVLIISACIWKVSSKRVT